MINKVIATLSFMLLSIVAFSQVGTSPNSNSGNNVVTVNIILKDIMSIEVIQASNVVNLEYNSEEDYQNGVTSNQVGHLNIFSTQNYKVLSAVWQENLITDKDIYLNNILQSRQYALLVSGTSGSNLLDVEYKAKGNNEYLTKNKQTYTTQVVYSIIPN